MSDDLVPHLRRHAKQFGVSHVPNIYDAAADRIEALESALWEIGWSRKGGPLRNKLAEKYEKIAVAALAGEKKDD